MTDLEYAKIIEAAQAMGRSDGANAGEWYAQDAFGGRVTRGADESATHILKGIEDGDPEILDTLPRPNLSGEWADETNGPEMFREILSDADVDITGDDMADSFTEVLDAYEQAYCDAAQDKIAALASSVVAS